MAQLTKDKWFALGCYPSDEICECQYCGRRYRSFSLRYEPSCNERKTQDIPLRRHCPTCLIEMADAAVELRPSFARKQKHKPQVNLFDKQERKRKFLNLR